MGHWSGLGMMGERRRGWGMRGVDGALVWSWGDEGEEEGMGDERGRGGTGLVLG